VSSFSFVSALLGVVLVTLACQEPDKHPPLASPCDPGQRCSLGLGQVGGPSAATGGSTGAGGGSTAGTAGTGPGKLSGTVVELVDDSFVTSIPFAGSAIVEAQASNGAVLSTTFDGQHPFTLTGVEPAVPSWISVRPSSGTENLRTLHPVATNINRSVDLGLVRADTLDEMFGILTVPAQLGSGTAQIVLAFSVTQGASTSGAAGVQVALPDSAFVAYKNGAAWSSDEPGTDTSGLVVLGNVPAVAFPGTTKRIFLSGSSSGFIDVRVAAEAVSLVAVPLSP
jgi:hypothetical protein